MNNVAIGPYALLNTQSDNNVALGYYALQQNRSGNNNIGIGTLAGWQATSTKYNISIGSSAMYSNLTGNNNVAIGYLSAYGLVSGSSNVSLGNNSLYSNTTGNTNLALGSNSLYSNTTGNLNIALGDSALYSNNLAWRNVAVGASALRSFVSSNQYTDNTAVGPQAMLYAASGNYNVAVGTNALRSGSYSTAASAYVATPVGTNNVAVGNNALLLNNGDSNVAIGYQSLASNTSGSGNIAIGLSSMYANIVGQHNISIGNFAAGNLQGGPVSGLSNLNSFNTIMGYGAVRYAASADYNTVIGSSALGSPNLIYSAQNTAIGANALFNVSGSLVTTNVAVGALAITNASWSQGNVAVGQSALYNYVGANPDYGNTAIGDTSGRSLVYGSNNTFIGAGTAAPANASGVIVIGISSTDTAYGASATQSNQIVIGTSGHTASATRIAGNTVNVGAWVPYTASITNVTVNYGTGGSIQGSYAQIGKTIFFKILMNFGTGVSFSVSTNWIISLPVNAVYGTYDHYGAIGTYGGLQGGGTNITGGLAVFANSNSINLTYPSATAGTVTFVNSITPRTFAAGDWVRITGTYEAA
jgi:hypothetical protein